MFTFKTSPVGITVVGCQTGVWFPGEREHPGLRHVFTENMDYGKEACSPYSPELEADKTVKSIFPECSVLVPHPQLASRVLS